MRALPTALRGQLESAVLAGRRAAETGVRAALGSLGVHQESKPAHLNEAQARLRRGLRAKQRQLGGGFEVLVWECAYEQWHRLLFARFLAENDLLRHPEFGAPVTLDECEELAGDLGEPDGWSVAARFAAEILPGIFRLDDPCVRLRLAPEHRVALERIVAGLPGEVFEADDSLGWVYQYWQKDRKNQINASEVKIGGADLGPVTQLFTENYMVRFLLENSLGAWWAARHPNSPLIKEYEYLRFDDDGKPAAGTFDGWPDRVAEVTVMDPCCGSGHFLVEAFETLWRMRAEEEGLDPVTAQDAVLRDNLFGLELDPRCVQIAMFAVALTAWKQGGGWRDLPTPHIGCSGIPVKAPLHEWTALAEGDHRLERALERLHTLFNDADTLGSLIDPRRAAELASGAARAQRSFDEVDFEEIVPLLEKAASRETNDPATAVLGADAAGIARAADLLSRRYSLIVTNVPYLGIGKMVPNLADFAEAYFQEAKHDLATVFVERSLELAHHAGSVGVVAPQSWLYMPRYETYRREKLLNSAFNLVGRLGSQAFQMISGEVVNVSLYILSRVSGHDAVLSSVNALEGRAHVKAPLLRTAELMRTPQKGQLENPDSRVTFIESGIISWLYEHAESRYGLRTGDAKRFIHSFWELSSSGNTWVPHLSTTRETRFFAGRENWLRWEGGHGDLVEFAELGIASLQGSDAWGKKGVVVSLMGELPSYLYNGERFDNNCAVVWPRRSEDLPALWAYLSSSEFNLRVREVDQSLKVMNATLLKVPFDVDHWQRVAEEEFPEGLPEPWSDDPTQWLFEGRPEVATDPMQVAVGRLVGYRWPEQPEPDDLDGFGDRDGIACLPAVAGELPAADRLQALLAQAYSGHWSPGLVRQLLEEAGSGKKNLTDWLRDDIFKQHCKVFLNRPFVWHIWDGRLDGFSALVNYHRLNRAGLEKLTYTYLGDWIERQRADASEEVAGADLRLVAARELKGRLEAILEGEPPFDIYVRWKALHEQPIGWEPDLDDGVRLNIRPFVKAGVLRSKVNVRWDKDRGKNPDGSERHNDLHFTRAEKEHARQKAAKE